MQRRLTLVVRAFAIAMIVAACVPAVASAVLTRPLSAVSFSDANSGFIVGGLADGVFSWTKDGGQSWHAQVVPGHNLAAVTAEAGNTTATALSPYQDMLFVGTNLGAAVATQAPLLASIVSYNDMAYLAGNRRVVVGKQQPANDFALIASSLDGAAWQTDYKGPYYSPPDAETPAPTTQAELASIDAASGGTVAWTVGIDRTGNNAGPYKPLIFKTADGGSTWTTQTAPVATTPGLNCVAAADSNTAFIGQEIRTLLRTVNGGATWTTIDPGQTYFGTSQVKAIDALDANHVVVVGTLGKIAWSSNAASATPTWLKPATAPTVNALLGVQMRDATHWVVVGDNETILRTADGGATWTGQTQALAPTARITAPAGAHLLDSNTLSIEGTSTDGAGVGVARVEVQVQKPGPLYWNGSSWVGTATWLDADVGDASDGWDTWEKSLTIPSLTSAGSLTVWARATDGLGKVSTTPAWVTSSGESPLGASSISPAANTLTIPYGGTATLTGTLRSNGSPLAGATVAILPSSKGTTAVTAADGTFSFSVSPSSKSTYTLQFAGDATHDATSTQVVVTPCAKVTTPVVPSYVKHTKSFKAYVYLYPKHTAGTTGVTFYFQRRNSSGSYVTLKTVTAKAADSTSRSKCTSPSVKLKAGKWRVRAKHADASHATTYSSRKYFTVH